MLKIEGKYAFMLYHVILILLVFYISFSLSNITKERENIVA